MIRDLEVVLLSIPDLTSRAYVREAVQCYHSGAYRAAVVLAVAAGMDGLRQRLLELARSGGAPKPVVAASNAIEKRFADQDAFEAALIDAAERDATFFTPAEAGKARVVLKTRHLCAHPSGHAGSAEEARDAITAMTDLILSRPATLGMSGVTTLIARLASPTFFPDSADTAQTGRVAAAELAALHATLMPALVSQLVGLVQAPAAAAAAKGVRQNAVVFLAALLGLGGETRATVWRYAERLIEQAATTDAALTLARVDPHGLALTGPLVPERLVATVRRNLDMAPARQAAAALARENVLTPVERTELVAAATAALLPDEGGSAVAPDRVAELGLSEVEAEFYRRTAVACGSHTFQTAKRAIALIQALEPEAAARVPADVRVTYVLAVADNAARGYAAHAAGALVDQGLGPRAEFLDALAHAAGADPASLRARDTDWNTVRVLCESSGRSDVLPELVTLFEGATEFAPSALEMLGVIASEHGGALGHRAAAARDHMHAFLEREAEETTPF